MLTLFGVSMVGVLARGAPLKGLIAGLSGLLVGPIVSVCGVALAIVGWCRVRGLNVHISTSGDADAD